VLKTSSLFIDSEVDSKILSAKNTKNQPHLEKTIEIAALVKLPSGIQQGSQVIVKENKDVYPSGRANACKRIRNKVGRV